MIQFMIIAAPRSGTAWAANWLTTETSLCLHDPLFEHGMAEWDTLRMGRPLGIACTAVAMFPDYVRRHTARKVVLHRDLDEVNLSLHQMGLPTLDIPTWSRALTAVDGLHVDWRNLWENPEPIWTHLLDSPLDITRHKLLAKLNVQMDFERINPDPEAVRRTFRMAGLL